MTTIPAPEALECVFHKALSEGDTRGVDAALRLLAVSDPRRAQRLYDALKAALDLANALDARRPDTQQGGGDG